MPEWCVDWGDHTADPMDGEGYIHFWWDDMRPREVLKLLQVVFQRGVDQGRKCPCSCCSGR